MILNPTLQHMHLFGGKLAEAYSWFLTFSFIALYIVLYIR